MPSQKRSTGSADTHLSIIDELTASPFPDREGRQRGRQGNGGGWGGPGYLVAVLRASQDFWNDRSEEIVEAAEQELESDLAALAAILTARWGSGETVDLWPYLGTDGTDPAHVAPEPLGFLSNLTDSMQVWRLPSSGRWLALAVGQADRELPFELLAAVGETSSLPE
jgi:hypothetical protein